MKKHTVGVITQYDRRITTLLYRQPLFIAPVVGWLTLLGHPAVVGFVAVLFIFIGFGLQRFDIGYAFLIALIALLIGVALKFMLKRPRPDTYTKRSGGLQKSFSFPSGHALGAFVVYGTLAGLMMTWLLPPWGMLAVIGLVPLILLIGLSRVYLGAHYMLDVLGGWLLGLPVVWWIVKGVLGCACG